MPRLLEVEDVWAGYGSGTVLQGVGLSLDSAGSLALLGRNGMGKTTLLATLMGATRQSRGSIRLAGRELVKVVGFRRARAGLGWVPQERDIFASLSVEENLRVVARRGPWDLTRVYAMFPRLRERRRNLGNQLSGGEQQMLAMGRALMLNPRILLLDEPLEGLAPLIREELLASIAQMSQASEMAMILVEQHAWQILPITQQALVLERGQVVHQGASEALLAEPATLERWLGVAAH
jgi:branched-chain amino acid transport system ATP-binding protein